MCSVNNSIVSISILPFDSSPCCGLTRTCMRTSKVYNLFFLSRLLLDSPAPLGGSLNSESTFCVLDLPAISCNILCHTSLDAGSVSLLLKAPLSEVPSVSHFLQYTLSYLLRKPPLYKVHSDMRDISAIA
jgi:hypothetical protein